MFTTITVILIGTRSDIDVLETKETVIETMRSDIRKRVQNVTVGSEPLLAEGRDES